MKRQQQYDWVYGYAHNPRISEAYNERLDNVLKAIQDYTRL